MAQVAERERKLDELAAPMTLTMRLRPNDLDGLLRARRFIDALIQAARGSAETRDAPKTARTNPAYTEPPAGIPRDVRPSMKMYGRA